MNKLMQPNTNFTLMCLKHLFLRKYKQQLEKRVE
jgi:hypothetical protein